MEGDINQAQAPASRGLDVKLFKKILPDDPTEEDYQYWKRMLQIYLQRAEIADDYKLDVLFVLCGSRTFPIIEDCANYTAAMARLDKKFLKQESPVMMRYQLRSRKQKPNESVKEYVLELELLAKKCTTEAVSADKHRELLIIDALVSGLLSTPIKQRLLESNDSLTDMLKTASSMELASQNAQILTPSVQPIFAATSDKPSFKNLRKDSCFWCGGSKHGREACPARNSVCKKCGKRGHWAPVCLSKETHKSAAVTMKDDQEDDVQPNMSAVLAATGSTRRRGLLPATVNGLAIEALIDTGSDLSFVSKDFMDKHQLLYSTADKMVTLADNSAFKVIGHLQALMVLDGNRYSVNLSVVPTLVAPMIIGLDILGQHSQLTLSLGGSRAPATFCMALSAMNCPTYKLIPEGLQPHQRPLATASRRTRSHQDFIAAEVQRLLANGIIKESQSPWRAQCFVTNVDKKPRMVIDFSNTINIYTPVDAYPTARVDDILDKVATNTVFSTVDLRSAYHQIPLHPDDYKYTAFEACGKLYEFTRLPFGCTNAVAIFQRIMDAFIEKYGLQSTYAYIDDVIIGGTTQSEHDVNLARFMTAAADYGMQINETKCRFSVTSISYLGNIVSGGTYKPDPNRFKALLDFPTPTSLKQLNSLIGLFAYYAKWVPQCSKLTLPLTQSKDFILKHHTVTKEAQVAIDELKRLLVSASLAAPLLHLPMTLETDASEVAIGGTLSQNGRPVAFMSRTLSSAERNQSIVEREAGAIVECCRKWRHLLLSVPYFTIVTDQKSVSFLFDTNKVSKIKHEKLVRWRLELSEYKFDIQYRPGPENKVADPLSRVSSCKDSAALMTLHERLCHPGVTRLNHYVKSRNLPYNLQEIRNVVDSCTPCKELKPRFYKPPPTTLISATRPWERLSMDFIGPLPSSTTTRFILVVMDEYSRFPFAFPCSKIDAGVVIEHLQSLFLLFGTPSIIHSDRGTQFESAELHSFLLQNGVAKTRTTPYRPQGNGQCERMNGTIQKAINLTLRTFQLDKSQWQKVLPMALSSIRSLLCTATNSTPHDRFLNFPRASVTGIDLPEFLLRPGGTILHRRHVRGKGDPLVQPVKLVQTITPHYAQVEFPDGRMDTVSTHHLAPSNNLPPPMDPDVATHGSPSVSGTPRRPPPGPEPTWTPPEPSSEPEVLPEPKPEPPTEPVATSDVNPRTRYGRQTKPPDRYVP